MRHAIPSRAELVAAYGEAVDRWAGHQRAAHPTDEQHNGCCPVCADLVEQIDLHSGLRAKLEQQGWSPTVAESIAHEVILTVIRQIAPGGKK